MDQRKLFLGQQIRRLREARGWSLQTLAQQIGVRRQTLFQYEQGEAWPSVPVLLALAEVFSCSTDALLGLSDHPEPPKKGGAMNDDGC